MSLFATYFLRPLWGGGGVGRRTSVRAFGLRFVTPRFKRCTAPCVPLDEGPLALCQDETFPRGATALWGRNASKCPESSGGDAQHRFSTGQGTRGRKEISIASRAPQRILQRRARFAFAGRGSIRHLQNIVQGVTGRRDLRRSWQGSPKSPYPGRRSPSSATPRSGPRR